MRKLIMHAVKILIITAIIFVGNYDYSTAADYFPFFKVNKIVGSQAPDFTLKDLKGNKVTLSSFKGKPVFLNIWATWCTYCKRERAELNHLYRKYNDKGLVILSVEAESSIRKIKDYVKKRPARFMVLSDPEGGVLESYYVRGYPTNYLIGRDGIIKQRLSGYMKWTNPESEKLIEELLK